MPDLTEYLEKFPYYRHLNETQKKLLKQNAVIRKYAKGSMLYGSGDACLGMIYIIEGRIRTHILSEEGREVTLFKMESGEMCVLSASCIISQIDFDTYMTAESECTLLIVNTEIFGRLAEENIYVKCFQYETATDKFSSVMWSLQQILFSGFDRRLASFLVTEYDRTGNSEIKMTHEQIAQQVSSAREVVARMLKRFASDGLVRLKRGSICLEDINALRKL